MFSEYLSSFSSLTSFLQKEEKQSYDPLIESLENASVENLILTSTSGLQEEPQLSSSRSDEDKEEEKLEGGRDSGGGSPLLEPTLPEIRESSGKEPDSGGRLSPTLLLEGRQFTGQNAATVFGRKSKLKDLVEQAQACRYQPMEYFVAWQGVLTIAYSGIPPAMEKLKHKLLEELPFLPKEHPGSKWPKTTIACLHDDQRLSLSQLEILRAICRSVKPLMVGGLSGSEFNLHQILAILHGRLSEESFALATSAAVSVDHLSVVLYESCSLEKTLACMDVPLQQPGDLRPPSAEQTANVLSVMDEFGSKNLPRYWLHASKDGNRSTHYRGSRVGATLVHYLGASVPPALAKFRKRVEAALPGMYDWFPENVLHITLRGLT
eukprot:jgi/Mesen1/10445/ME000082S09952